MISNVKGFLLFRVFLILMSFHKVSIAAMTCIREGYTAWFVACFRFTLPYSTLFSLKDVRIKCSNCYIVFFIFRSSVLMCL